MDGKYSFNISDDQCNVCPPTLNCVSGKKIEVFLQKKKKIIDFLGDSRILEIIIYLFGYSKMS